MFALHTTYAVFTPMLTDLQVLAVVKTKHIYACTNIGITTHC